MLYIFCPAATAAAEETTEVVHVVVAAAGTVAISLTFPGAMIVAIHKGHRCRHPSTISTATRWDREYRMSTITMIRHITVTAYHREWSEQPLCPHTVYPRLDTMRHRPSKRCPRVRRSQAGTVPYLSFICLVHTLLFCLRLRTVFGTFR